MKKVFAMGFVAAVMGLVMGCVAQQGDGSEGENEVTGEATSALTDGDACNVPGADITGGTIDTLAGIQMCCTHPKSGLKHCAACSQHECLAASSNPNPPPPRGGTPINPPVGP